MSEGLLDALGGIVTNFEIWFYITSLRIPKKLATSLHTKKVLASLGVRIMKLNLQKLNSEFLA